MKKLITILGAGLLAFGMFTSCGAKDVNLAWSDESTSYEYFYDVTAGTVTDIDEPTSFADAESRKNPTTIVSKEYTFNYAKVEWTDGYAGKDASKTEGNRSSYTVTLYYDLVTTTTDKATSNVISKVYSRNNNSSLTIKKVGDKYFINPGARNQAEVTIDGDIEDDEFTLSVDVFTVQDVDDWKADGTTNYLKGDTVAVKKAVKSGASYTGFTLVRQ